MFKKVKRFRFFLNRNDILDTKAFTIGITNMGTATVYIDDSIPLVTNASFVFPVIGSEYLYEEGLKIDFGTTGTKNALITMLKPG